MFFCWRKTALSALHYDALSYCKTEVIDIQDIFLRFLIMKLPLLLFVASLGNLLLCYEIGSNSEPVILKTPKNVRVTHPADQTR
jgi:hypothetical protein